MNSFIYSSTGLIHFIAAIVALITGSFILISQKGNKLHIRIGYIYVVAMLALNVTAFMIFRLFGGFGVFHIAAFVSFITLLAGIIPAWRRKPNWLEKHFGYMYWSVIGLYAAFFAEMSVRVPLASFNWTVGITSGLTIAAGFYYQPRMFKKWTGIKVSERRSLF